MAGMYIQTRYCDFELPLTLTCFVECSSLGFFIYHIVIKKLITCHLIHMENIVGRCQAFSESV
jgi:hypothetical protein